MESVRLYSLLSGFSRALGLVCKKLTEHNLRVAYLAQVLAGHCGLDHQERKYLLIASMAGVVVSLLLGLGLGYLLARNMLHQLGDEPASLADLALRIAGGDLNAQFNPSRKEIGVFGAMCREAVVLPLVDEPNFHTEYLRRMRFGV